MPKSTKNYAMGVFVDIWLSFFRPLSAGGEWRRANPFAAAKMLAVYLKIFVLIAIAAAAWMCWAQEPNAPAAPKVRVNVLNVCSPSAEEQQEISSALARIPKRPTFSPDFEVDRGRSVLDPNANPLIAAGAAIGTGSGNAHISSQQAVAQFVRIRHDFPNSFTFSTVQYSFSRDTQEMVETLVFRVREPKDLLEISIESSASSVTTATAMLTASTPARRIKLERFGKSSVVLARCSGTNGPAPDQSAYQPLFSSASSILTDYRELLDAKKLIPAELARIGGSVARHKDESSAHHP
ncbi:MAG: hypothetical protein JWN74_3322 [Acidobacteriaceae bacterium]|nr:hypothetical protein [Acidobacteriaceae bacterium]